MNDLQSQAEGLPANKNAIYHTSSKNLVLLIIWYPQTQLGHLVSNFRRRSSLCLVSLCRSKELCMQRSPKLRKITKFFQKQLLATTEQQQQVMPMCLTQYQPITVPCCKGPVGRSLSVTIQMEQVAKHSSFYQQNRRHSDTFHKNKH